MLFYIGLFWFLGCCFVWYDCGLLVLGFDIALFALSSFVVGLDSGLDFVIPSILVFECFGFVLWFSCCARGSSFSFGDLCLCFTFCLCLCLMVLCCSSVCCLLLFVCICELWLRCFL